MKGKRIERDTVLDEIRLYNELAILGAYNDGLSFGQLLVALRGRNIRKHYMTAQTIEKNINELKQRQIKPIILLDADGNPVKSSEKPAVVPIDEERLSVDLRRLINLDYITKKDRRYVPLLATQDVMTIVIHENILNNMLKAEKERARAIQQGKVKPRELCSIHIAEGETTIYSPLFMSGKHRVKYEAELHQITKRFNRVMKDLYTFIQESAEKDFKITSPLIMVLIEEPWSTKPEE